MRRPIGAVYQIPEVRPEYVQQLQQGRKPQVLRVAVLPLGHGGLADAATPPKLLLRETLRLTQPLDSFAHAFRHPLMVSRGRYSILTAKYSMLYTR